MLARAVIGAGYGDEGKGLMVDALAASLPGAVVVRVNGGAQAGHTVTAPDGRRHVFHHLGSGALAGARTHLSARAVSHPMLFLAEREAVRDLGGSVEVTADPRGPVTTPWDVAANQAAEVARGRGRHGSCGLGFGEAVGRDMLPAYALSVGDLSARDLEDRLRAIRDGWLPARLAAAGVSLDALGPAAVAALSGDALLARFARDCRAFAAAARPHPDEGMAELGPVIFEGAQGLLLGMDRGTFPHVTRSFTGLANVASLARVAGIDAVEATYVTRAYVTRHGAGPLDHEGKIPFDVVDPTNVPNPWQETIRLAALDAGTLDAAVRGDLADATGLDVRAALAVTCIDQARGPVPVHRDGRVEEVAAARLPAALAAATGMPVSHASRGPTRETLTWASPAAMAA